MALILDGSTSILLPLTRKPSNFPAVTPKVHFCGFDLSLLFNPLKELSQVYGVALSILGFHYHIIDIHLHLIMHHIM